MASTETKNARTGGKRGTGARLDPEAWIQAALETLQQDGVDQVRVERLAKQLGVTKGSFYWHFRDRQNLLDQMLSYWFERNTRTVFDVGNRFHGEPHERLVAVMEDITGSDRAGLDLAVRAWARSDPQVAEAVRGIDQQRFEFMRELFADIGFDPADAADRARFAYSYVLGDAMAFNRESRERARAGIREKVRMLTS